MIHIRVTIRMFQNVLVQGKKIVESLYATRLFSYLSPEEINKFWDIYDLENDDWLDKSAMVLYSRDIS